MNHSLHCRYSTLLRDWSAVYFYNVLTFTDLSQVYDGPILRFFKTLYVKGVSFFPYVSLSFYLFFLHMSENWCVLSMKMSSAPVIKQLRCPFVKSSWSDVFSLIRSNFYVALTTATVFFFKQKHPFAHIFIVKFHTGIINSFSLIYHIKWSSITV